MTDEAAKLARECAEAYLEKYQGDSFTPAQHRAFVSAVIERMSPIIRTALAAKDAGIKRLQERVKELESEIQRRDDDDWNKGVERDLLT